MPFVMKIGDVPFITKVQKNREDLQIVPRLTVIDTNQSETIQESTKCYTNCIL